MRLTALALRNLVLSGVLVAALAGCAAADSSRGVPPQPSAVAEKAPGQAANSADATASPALRAGSVAEASEALGTRVRLPRYLPAGATQEGQVMYATGQGSSIATIGYQVGQRTFAVKFIVEPADAAAGRAGQATALGAVEARLRTQAKEPSDPSPATTTITWREGGTTLLVTGDLPAEELLKIARSLV